MHTSVKNDKNLNQKFDWECTNQSEYRPHSYAESDDNLSDKFVLGSPSSSSSDDNNFDSESDGECPPLTRHPHIEDDSSSDESDEDFKKYDDMTVKSATSTHAANKKAVYLRVP